MASQAFGSQQNLINKYLTYKIINSFCLSRSKVNFAAWIKLKIKFTMLGWVLLLGFFRCWVWFEFLTTFVIWPSSEFANLSKLCHVGLAPANKNKFIKLEIIWKLSLILSLNDFKTEIYDCDKIKFSIQDFTNVFDSFSWRPAFYHKGFASLMRFW